MSAMPERREKFFSLQVQALQHEAVTLREEIRGGKVGLTHVQATLEKMLQEHSHLATTVSRIMACLELVNQESNGRAAKHIATSHTSLGEQVYTVAREGGGRGVR